jgi:aspartate-semialdehyde dehydrogenase
VAIAPAAHRRRAAALTGSPGGARRRIFVLRGAGIRVEFCPFPAKSDIYSGHIHYSALQNRGHDTMNTDVAISAVDNAAGERIAAELRGAGLLREAAYIDGEWCGADGTGIAVRNPSTGECIGSVPQLGVDAARRAIDAAQAALLSWSTQLPQRRQRLLMAWHAQIVEHAEALARLLTLEQGKPLAEARGEIEYGLSFIEWFAEEGKRSYGEVIPSHLPGRQLHAHRQPVGVAALVTPWNFPHAMLARKAAAALAAGCSVVAYQSSYTPFSALALAELAQRAGLPRGVFSVLTGRSRTVVAELCANPAVRALSFTGSTPVGRELLVQCAGSVKRTCMELGGHAPFIAFADVPLPRLVEAALAAKFATSGQDCLAANRIYVQHEIYPEFLRRFSAAVRALAVGDGFAPGVAIGPLQHEGQVAKCAEHVADAIAKGARLLAGGRRHVLGGLFFEPTVLADVRSDMAICREETFGPVAAVLPFAGESDVVRLANDSEFGLAAYVYSADHGTCCRISHALRYGMVGVNSVKMTGAPIPFGGIRQSGFGKEGSRHGIDEFTDLKYVCVGVEAA